MIHVTAQLDHYGRVISRVTMTIAQAVNVVGNDGVARAVARGLLDSTEAPREAVLLGVGWIADQLRAEAESGLTGLELNSEILASVHECDSGVGYIARVVYVVTGRPVPRAADEGGDHQGPNAYRLATLEAEHRALRAARGRQERVRREGYTIDSTEPCQKEES